MSRRETPDILADVRAQTPDDLALVAMFAAQQPPADDVTLAMGPMESNPLAPLSLVSMRLAEANTMAEVKSIIDLCDAAKFYAKKANLNFELQNTAAEHALRARRKAGKLLAQLERDERAGAGRPLKIGGSAATNLEPSEYRAVLEETSTTYRDANRWQKIADVPEETFNGWLEQQWQAREEITTTGALRFATVPHVAHNGGNNEWYTPAEYILEARFVMGDIDLDPASTAVANRIIKAHTFYSADDDGLNHTWPGRVWLNPPYAQPAINDFATRLVEEYQAGRTTEAIVLVNNATETSWFQGLMAVASAVCFPQGRVKFWAPDRIAAPLQGQAVIYLGQQSQLFIRTFRRFGWCAEVRIDARHADACQHNN